MVRFYLIPIERNAAGDARGPKYFSWRYDPDPPALAAGAPWSMRDYGLIDYALICADVTDPQHTALAAQGDVGAIPTTLDARLTNPQVTAVKNRLEAINLPAGWITNAMTWREVLRGVTGIMLYMQRLTAITGVSPFDTGVRLSATFGSLPLSWRQAMQQAADDQLLDYSAVSAGTTVRALLRLMADQWGNRPLLFGSLATL